jgi:PKD repeat protein
MKKMIRFIKLLFSFTIVLLIAEISTILAATYYISPSGNDTSGAGSFSNPWATVYKGCSSMSAGDTLVLKDGTYTGDNNMFTFGSAGHYPPSGTSTSNYTTIKAENPGGATIDGEGVRQPFNGHDSDFLIIDGIVFKNSNGSVWAMVGNSGNYCTYLKITRCGFCDANSTAANPRCNNIEIRWGDYVLMEDCYTWGNGKYRFYVLDSNRVILRRCVDRLDRGYGDGSLMGSFRLYGANNCILQNCISIDSDQKEYIRDSDSPVAYASPKMIWFGANGSTGNTCNNNQVIGSMIVSCTANSFIGFIGTDSSVTGNSLTNCAFWNVSNEFWTRVPSASQVTTFTNCTFGNIMAASHASAVNSSEVQNGGLVTNSIVYNAHSAALANVSSNYNCLYGNTAGNYSGGSAGVNDYCAERGNAINPIYGTGNLTGGLKYVPRIESNSNLSGKANGGGAIGASIIKQTGVTGTLYGEAGYNVVTASNLWPFPYEDIIRTKMKAYNAGGVSGNRGFCAEGTTLTKYIWEYLGNPMPAEVYGGTLNLSPTATASANLLTGLAPLTVSFTGSGTDSDGSIASYAWNFGDGTTSIQQNPSHTYNSAGTYTATLTVTDNGGATGTATVTITVTGTATTYSINGYVRNVSGVGLSGAIVLLTGNASQTVTTAGDGSYQFANLTSGSNYTVTPSLSGYAFTPVNSSTAPLSAHWSNVNFSGSATGTAAYYIAGTVTSNSVGLAGVNMTISGSANTTTTTASNGYYKFTGLPENGNYVITASKSGYVFSPASITKLAIGSNQDSRDFTAVASYCIKGLVTNTKGAPLNGVTMTLSGATSATTTTNSNGLYQFTQLVLNGNYTVTPSMSGWGFRPGALNVPSLTSSLDNQSFSGSRKYYIRGTVKTTDGAAVSKAMVVLSGSNSGSIETDSNGNYSFSDLPEGSSYTVTAVKNGYSFNPSARAGELLAPIDGWDFYGTNFNAMPEGEIKVIGSASGRGTINPDKGETAKIFFKASNTGKVELRIFTLTGELVWETAMDNVKEGAFEWVPRNIASGVYIVHIKGPGIKTRKRIAILK